MNRDTAMGKLRTAKESLAAEPGMYGKLCGLLDAPNVDWDSWALLGECDTPGDVIEYFKTKLPTAGAGGGGGVAVDAACELAVVVEADHVLKFCRRLHEATAIDVDPKVVERMVGVWYQHDAARLDGLLMPGAADLYKKTRLCPSTITKATLVADGLLINGPLTSMAADGARAVLLHGWHDMKPVALKVYNYDALAREHDMWRLTQPFQEVAGIMPRMQLKQYQRGDVTVQVGKLNVDVAAMLVMPLYPYTLATLPVPTPTPYLLQVAMDVSTGLDHLHSRNIVHGDLTDRNMFGTSDGRYDLGDFGSAVASGQPLHEFTAQYVPSDFLKEIMLGSPAHDYRMLCATLLHKAGKLQLSSDFTLARMDELSATLDEPLRHKMGELLDKCRE